VRTFQWFNYESANIAQPHVIHPATFDGILQTIFTMRIKGGTELMCTVIPTHIDEL